MELLTFPPRDRGDDISMLSKNTLGESLPQKQQQTQFATIQDFFDKPFAHIAGPATYRELENAIERAVILPALLKK